MKTFDLEVFKFDWIAVFKHITEGKDKYTVIVNDKEKLAKVYEENKDSLWIGYNNLNYDNYIVNAILSDVDPYGISQMIINDYGSSYYKRIGKNYPLITYDVSFGLGFTSLKENEAYLGLSIDECPVSFDLGRPLTDEEIELVVEYCKRDNDATEHLFHLAKSSFETKLYLIKTFNLSKQDISKSTVSVIESVMDVKKKVRFSDEFDPFDFNQLDLKINKYRNVVEHFSNPISEDYKSIAYACEVAGIRHDFGIGGIHGAIPSFEYSGKLMLLDAEAYYPSMMIVYNWFARSIPDENKKLYAKMKKDRSTLKQTNKLLSDAYKLVLNTMYGCYKYKYSRLYDPRMSNNITIGGQVMLLDLIEQIEPYCKLVQSNTDGIIVIPYDEDKIMECVEDWQLRTGMKLEKTYADKIVQKDVNNYIMRAVDGRIKVAGAYVRQYQNANLRRTSSIVDKAVVEYLMNDIPVREYINQNNDALDYQIISKVGKTYDEVFFEDEYGNTVNTNRVNRVFAGNKYNRLYKKKIDKNKELVPSQPTHCIQWNRNVDEFNMNDLDKEWYINMAENRIKAYLGEK